jgi:hypothetical protein
MMCAQGNVPLYAINATTVEHVQVLLFIPTNSYCYLLISFPIVKAGIHFASRYDLRLALKSSGHDCLGRSTGRDSLLIYTYYFQKLTFTESFTVGGETRGSAVTMDSEVNLQTVYLAAQQVGNFIFGGTAATVALGGGYIQGAVHSALSQLFDLAADNAIRTSR